MAQDPSKANTPAQPVSDNTLMGALRAAAEREQLANNKPLPEEPPAAAAPVQAAAKPETRKPGDRRSERRPAGTPRRHIAANDDLPSIGGLIYALQQRPSRSTFVYALVASVVWFFISAAIGLSLFRSEMAAGQGPFLTNPLVLTMVATIVVPIAVFWFLALLSWRAQELRLMASAMTEVAVRLAEPDKMAEQAVASIGQTIRRQVAAMNDALSRALGRAGELEALVHNEVAALERSYSDNELRIRSLIDQLANEREALANNSERVSEALRSVGAQVAKQISGAGDLATKSLVTATSSIADTLAAKGEKITAAVSAAGQSIDRKLAERGAQVTEQLLSQGSYVTEKLQRATQQVTASFQQSTQQLTASMHESTRQVTAAVESRRKALFELLDSVAERIQNDLPPLLQRMETEQSRLNAVIEVASQSFEALETSLAQRTAALDTALKQRTQAMHDVITEQVTLLDETFGANAQLINNTLAERIRALDATLSERSKYIDLTLTEKSQVIDGTLTEKSKLIEQTLSERSRQIEQTLSNNASSVERSLVRHTMALSQLLAEGTESVQRTTEQLTAQSMEAADGLTAQAEMLKDVSKRLLDQIHGLTQRFENQGHAIMSAAQALDSSNAKIDSILERRHQEISSLLTAVSNKARELDGMMHSYTGLIENSLTKAEMRAKELTAALAKDSAVQSRAALAEIEQLRAETRAHTDRAVAELRGSFEAITNQVADHIQVLIQHFSRATQEMRESAQRTVGEMESTRQEMQRRMRDLPNETRQSAEAMRKMLADQMKALSSLSAMAAEQGSQLDFLRPKDQPPAAPPLRSSRTTAAPLREQMPTASSRSSENLGSVAADLARQLGEANASERVRSQATTGRSTGTPGEGRREEWSLGDLLARASEPETEAPAPPAPPRSFPLSQPPLSQAPLAESPTFPHATQRHTELRFNDIASALDDRTAAEIWQRFRRGERDFLSRHHYNARGQATFDEIAQRYRREPDFQATVDRYMADFERLLREAHVKDRDGRFVQNYLTSETGRVYLMLAHASGRLS